jgi:Group II intron, maturase-specific domain
LVRAAPQAGGARRPFSKATGPPLTSRKGNTQKRFQCSSRQAWAKAGLSQRVVGVILDHPAIVRPNSTQAPCAMVSRGEELAPYMRGWRSYFGFCETSEVLIGLTCWVRLRLRATLWRQWKTPLRRRPALMELGVLPRLANNTAGSGLGPWYLAKAKALSVGPSNAYFKSLGLPSCSRKCRRNQPELPCTDPYAQWCGRGRRVTAAPMPIIHP